MEKYESDETSEEEEEEEIHQTYFSSFFNSFLTSINLVRNLLVEYANHNSPANKSATITNLNITSIFVKAICIANPPIAINAAIKPAESAK